MQLHQTHNLCRFEQLVTRYAPFIPALIGALVFLPTLRYGFVWDDLLSVKQNLALRSWSTLSHVFWGMIDYRMYRPLTSGIPVFQFHLFGLHPWGYHLTSIVLHALVCYLVFQIALRLSGSRRVALFAGTLFALHAAHVEAVAWISAFAEPLAAVFILLGFLLYLGYRDQRNGKSLLLLCLTLFLGLLTKETAIVLPLLILIYELTMGDSALRKWRHHVPAVACLACTVGIYFALRHAVCKVFISAAAPHTTTETAIWTVPDLLMTYVRHLVVPVPLSPFYDASYVASPGRGFWIPIAIVVVLTIALWAVAKRLEMRLLLFCGIAILVPLLPVLNLNFFLPGETIHDRFLYLPSVFFSLLAGLLVFRLAGDSKPQRFHLAHVLGLALLAVNAFSLAVYCPVWSNDLVFYGYSARMAPKNHRPLFGLARTHLERGDYRRSEAALEQVLRLRSDPEAFIKLGQLRMRMGRPEDAEYPLRQALALVPDRPGLHLDLGQALEVLGRTDEARLEYEREIAVSPNNKDLAYEFIDRLPATRQRSSSSR